MKFPYHSGAAVFLLVKVHVTGVGRLEYTEDGMMWGNAQLRNDLIPHISVKGIVLGEMSEIPADHREAPDLQKILANHTAYDEGAAARECPITTLWHRSPNEQRESIPIT
ncbi:MAG: hypothetical protein WC647_14785 [Desulfomonilaceae bacterium]|jgi:hypothetical protein